MTYLKPFTFIKKKKKKKKKHINEQINVILVDMLHPIRVVEQGDYHVIVVIECSRVQHPMKSMLFIPYRISEYPLSWNLPCDSV